MKQGKKSLLLIAALIAAAMMAGGCGGSSGGSVGTVSGDPNGPENYTSEAAEKLIAMSNVYSLSEFVNDSSMTVGKGDILLHYQENGEELSANTNYLPDFLPESADEDEKNAIEDFYAVAIRADSEDETIENAYCYFGYELVSMDNPSYITVTDASGDTSIFDPSGAELYVPEDGEIISFEKTPKFDYVQSCVDGFTEWVREMNTMKALSGVEISSSAEESAATVFPGVSIAFKPVLHGAPRKYYNSRGGIKRYYTHKAWHRDTSITFTVMPLHRFSDGSDLYIVRVTGNTDTSAQYAHLSHTGEGIIEGLGTDTKPGALDNDNILGYNYKLQYTAQLQSDGKPIGTIYASATQHAQRVKEGNKGLHVCY